MRSYVRWQDLFGGYDLRGPYPDVFGEGVGFALGIALTRALGGPFLIGTDVRRESQAVALSVARGIRSAHGRYETVGVVPTPALAYLSRLRSKYGLSVTPSHNPLGFAGLKGITHSGSLFGPEWTRIRASYEGFVSVHPDSPANVRHLGSRSLGRRRSATRILEPYLAHITRGLMCHQKVVLDCRGGATAVTAPAALRRMGAKVAEVHRGFSPRFFGESPEPRADNVRELTRRVRADRAAVGFAFDGDGDRCLVVAPDGRPVEPEVVAAILQSGYGRRETPLVASIDTSRTLDRWVPVLRSPVGSRNVIDAMEHSGALIGMERSGHFYIRRETVESDGLLVACYLAHAIQLNHGLVSEWTGKIGVIHRIAETVEFADTHQARLAFRRVARALGPSARHFADSLLVESRSGTVLARRSNTQPAIRFVFEAGSASGLRRVWRESQEVLSVAKKTAAS
jgi:phosphoglucosamine mutase